VEVIDRVSGGIAAVDAALVSLIFEIGVLPARQEFESAVSRRVEFASLVVQWSLQMERG